MYYDSLLLFVDNHVSAKVKSLHDAVCINLKEILFIYFRLLHYVVVDS